MIKKIHRYTVFALMLITILALLFYVFFWDEVMIDPLSVMAKIGAIALSVGGIGFLFVLLWKLKNITHD